MSNTVGILGEFSVMVEDWSIPTTDKWWDNKTSDADKMETKQKNSLKIKQNKWKWNSNQLNGIEVKRTEIEQIEMNVKHAYIWKTGIELNENEFILDNIWFGLNWTKVSSGWTDKHARCCGRYICGQLMTIFIR